MTDTTWHVVNDVLLIIATTVRPVEPGYLKENNQSRRFLRTYDSRAFVRKWIFQEAISFIDCFLVLKYRFHRHVRNQRESKGIRKYLDEQVFGLQNKQASISVFQNGIFNFLRHFFHCLMIVMFILLVFIDFAQFLVV